jgi:putative transcriptional regulator
MTDTTDNSALQTPLAHELFEALQEVRADIKGRQKLPRRRHHVPDAVDVKAIREKLNMTQKDFAESFYFSLSAVRHWEQGLRTPEAPIRAYLQVIAQQPDVVRGVVH